MAHELDILRDELIKKDAVLKIMKILNDLPQPDIEYILELLKHWQKIR